MLKEPKVIRVADTRARQDALAVLETTYRDEKGWVEQAQSQLPESDLTSPQVSWFVAYRGWEPAGVLRVYYDPPVAQYRAYQVTLLNRELDVDRFLATNQIAEIGRFANHLRRRQSWIFRSLTADWDERLHRRLAVSHMRDANRGGDQGRVTSTMT